MRGRLGPERCEDAFSLQTSAVPLDRTRGSTYTTNGAMVFVGVRRAGRVAAMLTVLLTLRLLRRMRNNWHWHASGTDHKHVLVAHQFPRRVHIGPPCLYTAGPGIELNVFCSAGRVPCLTTTV